MSPVLKLPLIIVFYHNRNGKTEVNNDKLSQGFTAKPLTVDQSQAAQEHTLLVVSAFTPSFCVYRDLFPFPDCPVHFCAQPLLNHFNSSTGHMDDASWRVGGECGDCGSPHGVGMTTTLQMSGSLPITGMKKGPLWLSFRRR